MPSLVFVIWDLLLLVWVSYHRPYQFQDLIFSIVHLIQIKFIKTFSPYFLQMLISHPPEKLYIIFSLESWCQALSLNISEIWICHKMMKCSRGLHHETTFMFTPLFGTLIDFWSFKLKLLWNLWAFVSPMQLSLYANSF